MWTRHCQFFRGLLQFTSVGLHFFICKVDLRGFFYEDHLVHTALISWYHSQKATRIIEEKNVFYWFPFLFSPGGLKGSKVKGLRPKTSVPNTFATFTGGRSGWAGKVGRLVLGILVLLLQSWSLSGFLVWSKQWESNSDNCGLAVLYVLSSVWGLPFWCFW